MAIVGYLSSAPPYQAARGTEDGELRHTENQNVRGIWRSGAVTGVIAGELSSSGVISGKLSVPGVLVGYLSE